MHRDVLVTQFNVSGNHIDYIIQSWYMQWCTTWRERNFHIWRRKKAPHGEWQCNIEAWILATASNTKQDSKQKKIKKMLDIVLAVCWFQSKIRLTSGRPDPASLSYGGALLAGDHSLPTWLMWDWQSGEVLLSFIWNSKKQCPWLRVQEYICSISRHDINTHVEL